MTEERPDASAAEEVFRNIPDVSRPPWTEDEVGSLNDYQESGVGHPFTHAGGEGPESSAPGDDVLVATKDGWYCPNHPDYTQDWAWPWMVDDTWRLTYS